MHDSTPSGPASRDGSTPFPDEWLPMAVELAGVGSWALNLATQRTEFSQAQRALLGFEGDATLDDVLARIHPDDMEGVAASLKGCAEQGLPYDAEFRFAHPERGTIWIGGRASRTTHPMTGEPYVVGINFDVTRRRTAEIDAGEMSREMAHRMKNVFALVSGISRIIARTVEDVPSFTHALGERLGALSRLSDMTLHSSRRGISLRQLVDAALSPYDPQRIKAEVQEARVNNAAAQTLLLALNELSTNAIKYGALKGGEGSVRVQFTADPDSDLFRLEWTETTEEPITEPDTTGFGTQVLTRVTRNTYGGSPTLDWSPEGLRFQCDWALSRMVA